MEDKSQGKKTWETDQQRKKLIIYIYIHIYGKQNNQQNNIWKTKQQRTNNIYGKHHNRK